MVAAVEGFDPAHWNRIVIKIGSSLLVDREGHIREDWLKIIVEEIAERHAAGQQIIIVLSGENDLGARRRKLTKGGRRCGEEAQAGAATGKNERSETGRERGRGREGRDGQIGGGGGQ